MNLNPNQHQPATNLFGNQTQQASQQGGNSMFPQTMFGQQSQPPSIGAFGGAPQGNGLFPQSNQGQPQAQTNSLFPGIGQPPQQQPGLTQQQPNQQIGGGMLGANTQQQPGIAFGGQPQTQQQPPTAQPQMNIFGNQNQQPQTNLFGAQPTTQANGPTDPAKPLGLGSNWMQPAAQQTQPQAQPQTGLLQNSKPPMGLLTTQQPAQQPALNGQQPTTQQPQPQQTTQQPQQTTQQPLGLGLGLGAAQPAQTTQPGVQPATTGMFGQQAAGASNLFGAATGTGKPPVGTGQPTLGTGLPTVGTGQPATGLPTVGTGLPTVGTGQPTTGLGQPTTGLGQPTTGQPTMGTGLGTTTGLPQTQPTGTKPPTFPQAAPLGTTAPTVSAAPTAPTAARAQQQQQAPRMKVTHCDNYGIRDIIRYGSDMDIQQLFSQTNQSVNERLSQGPKWYDLSTNAMESNEMNIDGELKSKCFDNRIRQEVYDVIIGSVDESKLNIFRKKYNAKKDKQDEYEKGLKDFKQILFCHYCDQRFCLVNAIYTMFSSCLINDVDDIFIRQERESKMLSTLFKNKLIQNLVISFKNTKEVLAYYSSNLLSDSFSYLVCNFLANEQIKILQLFIMLQHYFFKQIKQSYFDVYTQAIKELIVHLADTKLQGIFYQNENICVNLQDAQKGIQKLVNLIEKTAQIFIISQVAIPLTRLEEQIYDCENNQVISEQALDISLLKYTVQQGNIFKQLPESFVSVLTTLFYSQRQVLSRIPQIKAQDIQVLNNKDIQGDHSNLEDSFHILSEILRVLKQSSSNNVEVYFAASMTIYQWMSMVFTSKDDKQEDLSLFANLLSQLLNDDNVSLLFKYNFMQSVPGRVTPDYRIYHLRSKLKQKLSILSHYKEDSLELLKDDYSFWEDFIRQLQEFKDGIARGQFEVQAPVTGRHPNASLSYYYQDQQVKREKQSIGLNLQQLAKSVKNIKEIFKFLATQVIRKPMALQHIAFLTGNDNKWSDILHLVLHSGHEVSYLIQIGLENFRQDPQIQQIQFSKNLINHLLQIGQRALIIVNTLLADTGMRKETANIISSFAQNNQSDKATKINGVDLHPLLELLHICCRFEASCLYQNKKLLKIYSVTITILQTLLQYDYVYDIFPNYEQQQIQQNTYYQPQSFILNSSRISNTQNDNVQKPSTLFQNLLNIYLLHFLSRWQHYDADPQLESIKLQKEILHTLSLILQKFSFRKSVNYQDTQLHRTLTKHLNQVDSKKILEFLLSQLDMEVQPSFLEDQPFKQVAPKTLNMIGLSNIKYEKIKLQQSMQHEEELIQLQIRCLQVWSILMDLRILEPINEATVQYDPFVGQVLLVKAAEQLLTTDIYHFEKLITTKLPDSQSVQTIIRLNFVHGILGLMKIKSDDEINDAILLTDDQVDNQWHIDFANIYYDQRMDNYKQMVSRNTATKTTLFSMSIRILSKFNTSLESLITTIQLQENNFGYIKTQVYSHLIIQTLQPILLKLQYKENQQELQDILEFLIISLDSNQSFMSYLLKSQNPMQGQAANQGIRNFLNCFVKILDDNTNVRIPLLVCLFFYKALNDKNKSLHFAKVCRNEFASEFITLMKQTLAILQHPADKLAFLMDFGTEEGSMIFRNQILERTSTALQQTVIENCITDATLQLAALEYLLKIVINEVKQEKTNDSQGRQDAFSDFMRSIMSQNAFALWFEWLIRFTDSQLYNQYGQAIKSYPNIQYENSSEVLNYLQCYNYSYGRDFRIDSQTIFYQLKNMQDKPNRQFEDHTQHILVQRINIMSGWFNQLRKSQDTLAKFAQFTLSYGISGYPYNDDIRVEHDIFEPENIELGLSIYHPNHQKGSGDMNISLLYGDPQTTFDKLLKLLEVGSKELYQLYCKQVTEELFLPHMTIMVEIYNAIRICSGGRNDNFGLQTLINHQLTFFKQITKVKPLQSNTQAIIKYSRHILLMFQSFLLLIEQLSRQRNTGFIDEEPNQTNQEQQLLKVQEIFGNLIQLLQLNSQDNTVQYISQIMSLIFRLFKHNNNNQLSDNVHYHNLIKLQLEQIKQPQNNSNVYQAVIQSWIDIIQLQPNQAKLLKLDHKILAILMKNSELNSLRDEPIYKDFNHNYKHIMWCHTLILLRESVCAQPDQLRQLLEFIAHFEQRIYSALLQLDVAQNYQQLKQFTTMTGQTYKQILKQDNGLMLLFEINQILQLFLSILLSDAMLPQYAIQFQKIIYAFLNILQLQVGNHKKLKQVLTLIQPYTDLDKKLNEVNVTQTNRDFPKRSPFYDNLSSKKSPSYRKDTTISSDCYPNRIQPRAKINKDIDNINCFQMLVIMEYLRFGYFCSKGICISLNLLQGARNSLLEENFWMQFSTNIQNFIYQSIDIFVNLSRNTTFPNLVEIANQTFENYDFQLQHGGLHRLCVYPENDEQVINQCMHNIIYGFQAVLQYLNLRYAYKQVHFQSDSNNQEIHLTHQMIKLIETLINDQHSKAISADIERLNKIRNIGELQHDATDTYWNKWKGFFEQQLREYSKQ